MKEYQLAVDVLCDWLGYAPSYRLYLDEDLITERTYIWDNTSQYVREHISVILTPGRHNLTVAPVKSQTIASFNTVNFTVDGEPRSLSHGGFEV